MNAVIEQPHPETPNTRPYSQWFEPHPQLGISLMDHLYNRLDGAYPHKWRSNFANQQAIDNWMESWVEAFEEEGITPEMVRSGLKVIRRRCDWPPSCAEFVKACKPSVDAVVAYYEAVAGIQARANGEMGLWSHPAIFWAAMPMAFDLGQQTYSQMKGRWERALAEQLERTTWEQIPTPLLALPEPGRGRLSREKAAQMVQELGAAGITKTAEAKVDHRRWAKKILERAQRGDRSLTVLQIKFAEEALLALPPQKAGGSK